MRFLFFFFFFFFKQKMLELRIVELEETLKAERTRDMDRKHLGI